MISMTMMMKHTILKMMFTMTELILLTLFFTGLACFSIFLMYVDEDKK